MICCSSNPHSTPRAGSWSIIVSCSNVARGTFSTMRHFAPPNSPLWATLWSRKRARSLPLWDERTRIHTDQFLWDCHRKSQFRASLPNASWPPMTLNFPILLTLWRERNTLIYRPIRGRLRDKRAYKNRALPSKTGWRWPWRSIRLNCLLRQETFLTLKSC